MSNKIVSIGDALQSFIRENNLSRGLSEIHIEDYWKQVVGTVAMPYTKSIEVRDQTLYVKIDNAALRNELFIRRFDVVKRINEIAGYTLINNIRLS